MNKLKFRVQDREYNSFIISDQCGLTGDGNVLTYRQGGILPSLWIIEHDNSRFIVQQYIGLKDKDGIDIYEGDIVEEIWVTTFGEKGSQRYIIKFGEYYDGEGFLNTGFYSDFTMGKQSSKIENGGNLYTLRYNIRKVVGNILENPELLNK